MTGLQAHEVILEKLDAQSKLISGQGARLINIERTLSRIEVQDEKISFHAVQIKALFRKYDEAFGPDGIVPTLKAELKASKASCPKEQVENALKRQWAVLGFIGTMITAGLLKTFGIFK